MDELKIPAAFERVWERVTAIDDCDKIPETLQQELERFIEGEQCAINLYGVVAGNCGVKERQVIFQIIADEHRHLKNLQIEYFMLTGDMNTIKPSCVREHMGVLSLLRGAYLDEVSAAEKYRRAMESRGGDLGKLYADFAEDERRHARLLKEIICRAL
ncbi:MAG: ferritin-like domain-containing protein [Oscillospiraceae bacterium]